MSLFDFREVLGLDFGKQNDVRVGEELRAGADSTDEVAERVIRGAKVRAIAMFKEYPGSERRVDPAQMRGMDRQSSLILLAGAGENAQRKRLCINGFGPSITGPW
ncbi:hypothetical protein MHPYR_410021 [uncultured Mycobacterium sp.]|uniref:Uncharacterized protein n=1 Tax=uncultured Mycobacterium sp. TaxID=171292 RepID=A0A1Y5PMF3_9MYCO|nr:hypothetical protein MHPYR_410021 [uncultured Mycobacterium sp.]